MFIWYKKKWVVLKTYKLHTNVSDTIKKIKAVETLFRNKGKYILLYRVQNGIKNEQNIS